MSSEDRPEVVATADHIDTVVAVLRELDLGETAPAAVYQAGGSDAAR
ncbi:hypothetical protein [Amycolatopsis thermoflava]|uniref:Uncharacterized protein n=1 Tax=Amycolatopsis thermoflava TaxID=84480 RepID=A0A3N2GQ59_9PSEU|nr:hypothetical protein [Amycolatopsis thermoflava]ROS38754.1 hypothetical protein EDD35_1041 [Amycolatopsis thermoflava]